jgi:hypothetical protein
VGPVDMPVSLAPGHIRTGPFRLNLRQLLGISGSRYQLAMGRFMGREWDNAGARLLLKDKRRTTGSLRLEVDSHIDAVADVDEGNALIHPVVLTVEDHGSMNLA